MPLVGTLRDLSLPNLVQFQCNEQTRTVVTLTHHGIKGTVAFADGELVAAATGDKVGAAAVYDLLTWEDGDFCVEVDNTDVTRNVNVPWSALLLEGLRLADEARAARDQTLEQKLRELDGKPGLRGALVVDQAGNLRAAAKVPTSTQDAALVAFAAGQCENIGASLQLGAFSELGTATPKEKIIVKKFEGNYLGMWLEPRTTGEQVKALFATLEESK